MTLVFAGSRTAIAGRLCALGLGAWMLAPGAATHAQTARSADLKIVVDCLKTADRNGELGTACIGVIADTCTRKTGGDVAQGKACAERELVVWSALSEAAAKRVRTGGFKDISNAVAESEKGWLQQRDALCAAFDRIEPRTLPGDAAYCRMQSTAQRALLLRKLGAAVNVR